MYIIIKKQLACSASRQELCTHIAAYFKTQLDLDASRGVFHSYLLCTISFSSSLPVVQAGRSNAFTSAAYVKTQLDLDASRGVSHSYLLCTYSHSLCILECGLYLMQAAGSTASISVAYFKTQLDPDSSRGSGTILESRCGKVAPPAIVWPNGATWPYVAMNFLVQGDPTL